MPNANNASKRRAAISKRNHNIRTAAILGDWEYVNRTIDNTIAKHGTTTDTTGKPQAPTDPGGNGSADTGTTSGA